MLVENLEILCRTFVTGVCGYAIVIVVLRISGKRTLSKWNAFDFIVTIALGSILATMILSGETSLMQGAFAFALLIGLQFVVTWISVRVGPLRRLVNSRPTLLLYHGEYRHEAMKQQRVIESEVLAAIREKGIASLDEVGAVVLESDGSFSVISSPGSSSRSSLVDVVGFESAFRS